LYPCEVNEVADFLFTTLNQCEIDLKIMSVEIKFLSSVRNEETDAELTIKNVANSIFIVIKNNSSPHKNSESIFLDKYTAAKLAKELRKQISFLED
jgi:hypothetical protein